MKIILSIQMILGTLLCTSCIEEYNELPTGQAERMVAVDGQIISERDCTFTLRFTSPLGSEQQDAFPLIAAATVVVEGSNGQRFVGRQQSAGRYMVQVGTLKANEEYSVRIVLPGIGTFQSQPMRPIDTPDVAEVTFEQNRPDRLIDFMISTSDPQGPMCLLWEYDETWEVFTPYTSYWDYRYEEVEGPDPFHPAYEGEYQRISPKDLTNHGWSTFRGRESVIATNADYGQGAVTKLCLYQRHPDDNRFQTRYLTRVRQMAISQQEYEYRHLLATQSTEMGGLFTPMPSELPSNITTLEGDARAVGFVGVRGKVCETELYVRRQEVGHQDTYRVVIVPDSLVLDPVSMLKQGFRIIDYNEYSGKVQWSDRWAVDCTDHFWSASLQRPDYWR